MEFVIAGLLLVVIVLLVLVWRRAGSSGADIGAFDRLEGVLHREIETNRRENNEAAAKSRAELEERFSSFEGMISRRLQGMSELQSKQLTEITRTNNERLQQLGETVDKRMESVRESVEKRLGDIQSSNEKKLETMRQTVDEKLHKTLEERLGESFKSVSERLEQVHKGLGEMQSLAAGVGDLKNVLTNVKTRGILGEIQLEAILDQMLSPEQYEKNIATIPEKSEVVEFAVKLPGKEEERPVFLPIDSKFPLDRYERLLDAYDTGDQKLVNDSRNELVRMIKDSAGMIRKKYIEPPYTTDFGILFLPVEGLYAEVVRQPGLVELLQRDHHINIAGPTTLSAMLNALQLGFKTLAIEKRSSEVWRILGAVKTEFDNYAKKLEDTQKHLKYVNKDIEDLIGPRTRQIIRKLRDVQELPSSETEELLDESGF